ncbi:hypothetical protein B0J14DRAFT_487040 [Halenospora varia]|nr:hypothetical protein B0J14DRAFT_487040 [Halenospora varia]
MPRSLRHLNWNWSWRPRNLLNLPHLLVAVWLVLLLWGERRVFQGAIEECKWGNWERWPKDATPHHLVFLADPQLIDPHSYPGRPWPLDQFTFLHTDNFMKRSYISLQQKLHPDTIFFLGDLFDGGREWKTAHGNFKDPMWANGLRPSSEEKYAAKWGKRYGEDFWLHEYNRFGRIFFKYWNLAGSEAGPGQRGRKIISTLPGNHDLGFGDNIKLVTRNRFEVYFGEGNRVDVIGNHTFVSIDAVSLSAAGSEHEQPEITKPIKEFLEHVQVKKRKAVAEELSHQAGKERVLQYPHSVEILENADFSHLPTLDPGPDGPEFPTILLTHVPLYRQPGTPCGPKREHWPPETPPKGQTTPVIPDHRNAISISKGYQYQNVLSEGHSIEVMNKIGNVKQVFSGDDHDYCEIIHEPTKNSAREITVKAFSWAMGVRKPGFLMLSMWNPVDASGKPLNSHPTGHGSSDFTPTTTESHLCLLPDQLGIFTRYGILIAISLLALTIRSILVPILNLPRFSEPPTVSSPTDDGFLLPLTNRDSKRRGDREDLPSHNPRSTNSSTSSTHSNPQLAPRTAARTRSVSPANGYGLPASQVRFATPPLINGAGYYGAPSPSPKMENGWSAEPNGEAYTGNKTERRKLPETVLGKVWREMWTSLWRVTWLVLGIYFWLIWFYPE